jgi:hypothetical protein
MITEDYVSYEVAKLLKDKGFPQEYDIYHSMVYNEEDYEDEYEVQRMVLETKLVKAGTLSSYPVGVPEPKCYCPTLQMAMKWLREEHNIFIEISVSIDLNGNYHYSYSILNRECKYVRKGYTSFDWNYEQACEIAIKYTLENLI